MSSEKKDLNQTQNDSISTEYPVTENSSEAESSANLISESHSESQGKDTVESQSVKLAEFLRNQSEETTEISKSKIVEACGCDEDKCVAVLNKVAKNVKERFLFVHDSGKLLFKKRTFTKDEKVEALAKVKAMYDNAQVNNEQVSLSAIMDGCDCTKNLAKLIYMEMLEKENQLGLKDDTDSSGASNPYFELTPKSPKGFYAALKFVEKGLPDDEKLKSGQGCKLAYDADKKRYYFVGVEDAA